MKMQSNNSYNIKSKLNKNGSITTYFEWAGGDQKILLLHGFPETPHVWEKLALQLQGYGYTVIAPYLLGYENVAKLDRVITIKELAIWLNNFAKSIIDHPNEKVILVGHDFGAATSYAALTFDNHCFSSYIALAIPPLGTFLKTFLTHPVQAARRRYILMFCIPFGIGQWYITKNNFKRLKRLMMKWCEGAERSTAYFSTDLAYERLPNLIGPLALYKGILPSFSKFFSWWQQFKIAFTPINTPTKIFVGQDETTYPLEIFRDYKSQFSPKTPVSLEVIPSCGHFIPLDGIELIIKHILELKEADMDY